MTRNTTVVLASLPPVLLGTLYIRALHNTGTPEVTAPPNLQHGDCPLKCLLIPKLS